MSSQSKIEWTEQTWNPATGCDKVSPGCKHCYAEIMAGRLKAMKASGYQNGFDITLQPHRLDQPLKRKKPTVYFVNSMSDLFHEDIPDDYIDQVFEVIRQTPHHTYQILTKRAYRLPKYFVDKQCPSNVWLGVTVEDKKHGVPRIQYLQKIKASVRFVSVEPLLEDIGPVDFSGIHWVIVGGESGSRARPMQSEWAENVRLHAKAAGAAYFFKQWGTWGADGVKRAKQLNGRKLNGKIYDEYPEIRSTP
jgi:protein gp37